MDSDELHQEDTCSCNVCRSRDVAFGLPLVHLPPEQLQTEVDSRVQQTYESYNALKVFWKKLNYEIISRWRPKDQDRRKKQLARAVPALPSSHRPELDLRSRLRHARSEGERDSIRRFFPLAFMNVEDLSKDDNLLSLLKARATLPPGHFAISDLRNANITTFGHDVDRYRVLAEKVMLLSPDESKPYGILRARRGLNSGDSEYPVMIGHATVGYQADIYPLLEKIAREVLRGYDLSAAALLEMEDVKEDDVRSMTAPTVSLQDALDQSPFHEPLRPNFVLLDQLATSKRNEAVAHFAYLRENPSYFRDCLKGWLDHEQLEVDENTGAKSKAYGTALWRMTMDALLMIWLWNIVQKSVRFFKGINETEAFDIVLYRKLHDTLEALSQHGIDLMGEAIPLAESFEPHIRKTVPRTVDQTNGRMLIHRYVPKLTSSNNIKRVFELFSAMCSDEGRGLGLQNLTAEIDRLRKHDNQVRGMVNPFLSERFADLVAVHEVQAQLQLWQPSAEMPTGCVQYAELSYATTIASFEAMRGRVQAYCEGNLLTPNDPKLQCFARPTNDPTRKEKQREACESLETWFTGLDDALDWGRSDNDFRSGITADGRPQEQAWSFIIEASKNLKYLWTLDAPDEVSHAKVLTVGKRKIGGKLGQRMGTTAGLAQELSRLLIQECGDPKPMKGRDFLSSNAKPKEKRRPERTNGEAANEPAPAQDEELDVDEDPPPRIPVDKDVLRLFQIIFGKGRLGQIDFTQFRYAMSKIGFEIEPRGGSVWLFKPEDKSLDSIRFHENHGTQDSKLGHRKLVKMAADLQRTYKWCLDTFVLRQKDGP